MNNLKILRIYLFIVGLILAAIGGLTAFNSIAVKANEGIKIAGNASALSDVRSFGILLIVIAVISFLGSFKNSFRKFAIQSTILLFLSLGSGRLLSMFLDGMPSSGMVKATVIEIILGLVGLSLFISNRKK